MRSFRARLDGAQVFILPLLSAHNLDSCIFERRRQQLSLATCALWVCARPGAASSRRDFGAQAVLKIALRET
jgi:hypothetical protein